MLKPRPKPRIRTVNDPAFVPLARRFTLTGVCRELVRHVVTGTLHIATNGNVDELRGRVGIDNARAFFDEATLKLSERP